MSDSVRPHRQQPTRLPRPWDSPGKNPGVGCHFLLQCMKVKSESKSPSRVRLLVIPWTAAYQSPPSMGFSRQEYWSGLPLPSPEGREGWLKIILSLSPFFFFSQYVEGWYPLVQLFRGQLYFFFCNLASFLQWVDMTFCFFCPPLVAYGILSFLMYGIHALHSESADSQPLDCYEIPWYDFD